MSSKFFKIYVRSKDVPQTDSEFNSSMTINLAAGLTLHENERFRIKLDSAEIPHSFYNVSKYVKNDQIFIDGVMVQLIPGGNYSVYDMIDYLTAISSFPYSATYDEVNSKITLTNTDSTTHIINFTGGLAKLLGYKEEDRQINANASLPSFNAVNFQSIHSLFIHSSLASTNVITTETNSFRSILGKIPVNRLPYEILSYEPSYSSFNIELDDRSITTFNLEVRDQNSNLIQFNGLNFEVSLLLEVYKKEKVQIEPTRRIESSPIVPQPVPQPSPPIITQPSPQPDSPRPVLDLLPRPSPAIQKSEPIDIPSPNMLNHELEDAILAASLLDLEGLL